MLKDRVGWRIFFEGDSGGGSGGSGGDPGMGEPVSTGSEGDPSAEPQRPKYFAQIAPEKVDSEDYKRLYKYQRLDELADAAVSFEVENERLKKEYERSIVVPDGKDPEAVKKFALALGVPEDYAGYDIPSLAKETGFSPEALTKVKQACHKYMMTGRQADAVGKILVQVAQDGTKNAKQIIEDRKKGLDATLQASYQDIQADTDRKTAAERDMAAYKAFAQESGLAELFERTGVAYNPQVIKSIAAFARTHAGQSHAMPSGASGSPPQKGYGNEFAEKYGGKA